jgi:uncharacterized protein
MKRLLTVAAIAASLCLPARAQDAGSPEALRAAQELATIMTGDTVGQMSSALTAQIWPSIEGRFGNKVDAATLAELRSEFEKTLTSFTGQVLKDAPVVYARYFTAQELRELLAFYKSPTGAKALRTMPKVMTDVSTQMAPHMQAFQQDLNTRIAAVMQKHGYKN